MAKSKRHVIPLLLKIIGLICSLVIIILVGFRIRSLLHETESAPEVAPAAGHFISVNNQQIYILDMGPPSGPALIFNHGFGAWSYTWKSVMEAVSAQGYRTIAIDVPPFGFSERPKNNDYSKKAQAERIVGVLEALGINRAVMVTHSYGGSAAMEAVFSHPERFEGLVMVDAALPLAYGKEQKAGSSVLSTLLKVGPLRNAVIAATITNPSFTKNLLSTFVKDASVLSNEKLAVYQRPLRLRHSTEDLGIWLATDLFAPPQDSLSSDESNYRRITMPVLIVWGRDDTVTPLYQGQYLHTLIPGSKLVEINDVNHIPHLEDPKKFVETILPFMDQHYKSTF